MAQLVGIPWSGRGVGVCTGGVARRLAQARQNTLLIDVARQQALRPHALKQIDALPIEGASDTRGAYDRHLDGIGDRAIRCGAPGIFLDVLARNRHECIHDGTHGHAVHGGIPALFLEVQARQHRVVFVDAGKAVWQPCAQPMRKFGLEAFVIEEGAGETRARGGEARRQGVHLAQLHKALEAHVGKDHREQMQQLGAGKGALGHDVAGVAVARGAGHVVLVGEKNRLDRGNPQDVVLEREAFKRTGHDAAAIYVHMVPDARPRHAGGRRAAKDGCVVEEEGKHRPQQRGHAVDARRVLFAFVIERNLGGGGAAHHVARVAAAAGEIAVHVAVALFGDELEVERAYDEGVVACRYEFGIDAEALEGAGDTRVECAYGIKERLDRVGGASRYLKLGGGLEREVHLDILELGMLDPGETEEMSVDDGGFNIRDVVRQLMDEGRHTAFAREGQRGAGAIYEDTLELEADLLATGVFVAAFQDVDEGIEVLAKRAGEAGDAVGCRGVRTHSCSSCGCARRVLGGFIVCSIVPITAGGDAGGWCCAAMSGVSGALLAWVGADAENPYNGDGP